MQLQLITSAALPPPDFNRFGETDSAVDSFPNQEFLRPERRRILDEDAPRRPVDRRSAWAEAYAGYRNDANRQSRSVAPYFRPTRSFTTTGFAAQTIAQENLSAGAHYEPFGAAINAYSQLAHRTENAAPGSIIDFAA